MAAAPPPTSSDAGTSNHADRLQSYGAYRFSPRVGRNIPESPQALGLVRHEWLELAKEENLGPPVGMTTFVGNIHRHTNL